MRTQEEIVEYIDARHGLERQASIDALIPYLDYEYASRYQNVNKKAWGTYDIKQGDISMGDGVLRSALWVGTKRVKEGNRDESVERSVHTVKAWLWLYANDKLLKKYDTKKHPADKFWVVIDWFDLWDCVFQVGGDT